ncbi:amidohydrolase family protein [Lichenicola sp.]|uniref:amidohydrolase family protein n=1 Tax=Lichenicola sp. TaxID=2804529 RepID=UPI003B00AAE1
MLDCHQHFWKLSRNDYDWMGEHVAPLLRDFMPDDLRPLMARSGITRTIVVQAAATEAETEFLLGLAAETDFIAGVVGWLDLDADDFPDRMQRFRRNPFFVGVRPMLQDLRQDDWILRPRVLRSLACIADAGMPLDILTFPRHLPHVIRALRATPGLKAVVDHLSKPHIAGGVLDPWRDHIREIAAMPDVSCKLSGMVTEAAPEAWRLEDLRPYVDHVVQCFGPRRLMFGSDWPVCTLAASYGEVNNAVRALLSAHFGPADMHRIFATNGEAFYALRAT